MTGIHTCPIMVSDPQLIDAAEQIANALQQTVCLTKPQEPLYLEYSPRGLCLHITLATPVIFQVDFLSAQSQYRQQHSGQKQLIARACGTKKNHAILDVTAGFGRDGFALANCGAQLTLVEQNPIIACLLADGLRRLKNSHRFSSLQIISHCMDGVEYLKMLREKPAVVYLDPMFQQAAKAQVKKDMQIARILTGENPCTPELLELALDRASDRVVVKRHRQSPYLNDQPPTHQIHGRLIRYDVYLTG